jgi:hypothetical protein
VGRPPTAGEFGNYMEGDEENSNGRSARGDKRSYSSKCDDLSLKPLRAGEVRTFLVRGAFRRGDDRENSNTKRGASASR